MREIVFRAKRLCDGEWEYGHLTTDATGVTIERANHRFKGFAYSMPVNPETVGQYIGLRDKYGRRICEGDIVKWFDNLVGKHMVAEVQYIDAAFCRAYKSQMGQQNLYINATVAFRLEVIGNRWDNPELLNGGDE